MQNGDLMLVDPRGESQALHVVSEVWGSHPFRLALRPEVGVFRHVIPMVHDPVPEGHGEDLVDDVVGLGDRDATE